MTIAKHTARADSVRTSTLTHTTHIVDIDLAVLLAGYDPTDHVVLLISTPSGRSKRVTLGGNFLVAPHHNDDYSYLS